MAYAKLKEYVVGDNPVAAVKIEGLKARRVRWQWADITTFADAALDMSDAYMAVAIFLGEWLAQRRDDVRTLTWGNYQDGCIVDIEQNKTGEELVPLPLPRELVEMLNSLGRGADHEPIIVHPETRRPYGEQMWMRRVKEIREKARLPAHLKFSDLRRTGATDMLESGATPEETSAFTGHKDSRVLEAIYTLKTARVAANTVAKRLAARAAVGKKVEQKVEQRIAQLRKIQ
jgi:integrase